MMASMSPTPALATTGTQANNLPSLVGEHPALDTSALINTTERSANIMKAGISPRSSGNEPDSLSRNALTGDFFIDQLLAIV